MNKYFRYIVISLCFSIPSVFADIEIVSVSSAGEQGNDDSVCSALSADGQIMTFYSDASNLVDNDTNQATDIFVHNRETGITKRINVLANGEESPNGVNHRTRRSSISSDGRFVAFNSEDSGLVVGDTNGTADVFLHDLQTQTTERVSIFSTGEQMQGNSLLINISSDGRLVFFGSNGWFIHDRITGNTQQINLISNGTGSVRSSVMSGNGKFIAFTYTADDLVTEDTNQWYDVFVYDIENGITELVSISSAGIQGNSHSSTNNAPSISHDGRFIAFDSFATNLKDGETTTDPRLFVRDRETGTTELVPLPRILQNLEAYVGGVNPRFEGITPFTNHDARYVMYDVSIDDEATGTRSAPDIFIYDRITGITEIATNTFADALQGYRNQFKFLYGCSISSNGQVIGFYSREDDLVEDDTNFRRDAFVVENPLADSNSNSITIEKKINGESSITGGSDPLVTVLANRFYRADYTVTNTSTTRLYGVRVFDKEQGNFQTVCNLNALAPGQSRQCHLFFRAQTGTNAVPARVEAKISGEGTLIRVTTPQVSYVGQDALSGGLTVKHALNNEPGDDEGSAVMLATNTDQSWLFKVTNASNIDLYKVKVYNDGVFPQNTGWEELCLIGKLKVGETRYCKRTMAAGQVGLNLMMGRAQGNDSYRVQFHQYINVANPTYYLIEP